METHNSQYHNIISSLNSRIFEFLKPEKTKSVSSDSPSPYMPIEKIQKEVKVELKFHHIMNHMKIYNTDKNEQIEDSLPNTNKIEQAHEGKSNEGATFVLDDLNYISRKKRDKHNP